MTNLSEMESAGVNGFKQLIFVINAATGIYTVM